MTKQSQGIAIPPPLIPTPAEFILERPLYAPFLIERVGSTPSQPHISFVRAFFGFRGPLDSYCVNCNLPSVFHCMTPRAPISDIVDPSYAEAYMRDRELSFDFWCTRNERHMMQFHFLVRNEEIIKIGQFPSIADLATADLTKYRKVLGDQYPELTKAVGLASHGVGVGAFVYLRRIFERLIDDAYAQAKIEAGWREEEYARMRMGERIEALHGHLPQFLVENAAIYGIMSVGVHALEEEECLRQFPVIKAGIEIILDEKIHENARREKLKNASKAISEAAQQTKPKK